VWNELDRTGFMSDFLISTMILPARDCLFKPGSFLKWCFESETMMGEGSWGLMMMTTDDAFDSVIFLLLFEWDIYVSCLQSLILSSCLCVLFPPAYAPLDRCT
jgi:hypothetical protein